MCLYFSQLGPNIKELFRLVEDFVDVIGLRLKDFQDMYEVTDNLGTSTPGDLHHYLCLSKPTLMAAFHSSDLHRYNAIAKHKREGRGGRPDGKTDNSYSKQRFTSPQQRFIHIISRLKLVCRLISNRKLQKCQKCQRCHRWMV